MLDIKDDKNGREISIHKDSINMNNVEEIRKCIEAQILSNTAITLNLENLNYIDSAGLSLFIRIRQFCLDNNSSLALTQLQKNIALLLHATNLLDVLNTDIAPELLAKYLKSN